MGTKNNPGKYDCYANAHPDEPMFVLLGRDPWAASLVRLWAEAREMRDKSDPKAAEARECADDMIMWCLGLNKGPFDVLGAVPFAMLADELRRRGASVFPASEEPFGRTAVTDSVSIADQIACVKREIAMRESAYPKWVANGKMKQEKADAEIATMKAVLETVHDVERLRRIEAAARALVDESEEFSSDDGWACSAPLDEWNALNDALDPDEPEA